MSTAALDPAAQRVIEQARARRLGRLARRERRSLVVSVGRFSQSPSVEADDGYTGEHSKDVVDLTLAVVDELGLSASERRDAEFAALLHDSASSGSRTRSSTSRGP